MLSNSSIYAINAAIYLALHSAENRKIGVKEIADTLHIPLPFLAKILQSLARKGIISSNKGPGGGFWLSDDEKKAPLMAIIEQIGEGDKFVNCAMGFKECSNEKPCPLHTAIQPFRDSLRENLNTKSIADFASKVKDQEAFLIK
jgi:transcriptional regulator, Rrf2 family